MSIQTTVLENGQWITRNMNPLDLIRAQNRGSQRNDQSLPSPPVPSPVKAPFLGLLTRTLVRSSVTKWIIPARIRHRDKNDVLFITTNSVTIKEAAGDYTLTDVIMKDDFDSPIRSARILGSPRHLTGPDKYDNKDDPNLEDAEMDIEMDDEGLTSAIPLHGRELPPHIAVLALESNKLVFLFAVSGVSELPKLLCSQKEFPAATSSLDQLGEHTAVDPK